MSTTISPVDMASVEVLHTQNDSGSFPSSEFSLLPDADRVPNGDVDHNFKGNYDLTNMRSSFSSALPDGSVDVHSQLNELVIENNRLKENMSKNNTFMEAQIETIQSWRDHMLVSKNQLEENLKKANEKILSLEKDKAELEEKLNNLPKSNQQQVKTCEKCITFEDGLSAMLGVDYMEKNEDIIFGWSDFRENLLENLKLICQHLEVCKSNSSLDKMEKYLLDCYVLMLKFKIAFMEGSDTSQLHADYYSLHTDEETGYEVVRKKVAEKEKKEVQELRDLLRDKDDELTSLLKENKEFLEKKKAYDLKIKEWEMALKSQFDIMSNKLQTESALTEQYRERCASFEQQIEEYQRKLDQTRSRMTDEPTAAKSDDLVVKELQEEIRNLQEILKLEQKSKQSDNEKLREVMDKCEKLQVDYIRVSQLLEIQVKDDKEKDEKLVLIESDKKKYMEEADHQTAKLFAVQEQLIDTTNEMRRLQEELDQMKDKENILLLKDQISSYKKDFLEMEAAKNAASDEVERLKNELKMYESSSPRRSLTRSSHERRSSEYKEQNGAAAESIECPICQFRFTCEKAAQNHINRCLEKNQS